MAQQLTNMTSTRDVKIIASVQYTMTTGADGVVTGTVRLPRRLASIEPFYTTSGTWQEVEEAIRAHLDALQDKVLR